MTQTVISCDILKLNRTRLILLLLMKPVVAVTLTKAKKVLFIELNQDNVVKSFTTVGECYGIDHVANRFVVSVQGFGIQIFDDE